MILDLFLKICHGVPNSCHTPDLESFHESDLINTQNTGGGSFV